MNSSMRLESSFLRISIDRNIHPSLYSVLNHFLFSTSMPSIKNFSQFQDAMLFRDSALFDLIFKVFDIDKNDLIDFNEYITCLSTVSNKASPESKLQCKKTILFVKLPINSSEIDLSYAQYLCTIANSVGDSALLLILAIRKHNTI